MTWTLFIPGVTGKRAFGPRLTGHMVLQGSEALSVERVLVFSLHCKRLLKNDRPRLNVFDGIFSPNGVKRKNTLNIGTRLSVASTVRVWAIGGQGPLEDLIKIQTEFSDGYRI